MKAYCFDRKFFTSSTHLLPVQLPSCKETHLWYTKPDEVKDTSLLNQCLEVLSPCEKENVLRMRGEELQKRALLARALVRTTIARYQINSRVSPRSLKFTKNAHGKPEVLLEHSSDWESPPLQFNLSHTNSLIACGVTVGSPIGIDVEEKQRKTKHSILSLAGRYFTQYEVEVLAAISDPEIQCQEFIKLWTLKEAYVKALGRGFSGAPFKTFTIRHQGLDSEASKIIVDSIEKGSNFDRRYQFSLFEVDGSHYAAICKGASTESEESSPIKLTVWKTIPFGEDECVSGTDEVLRISGEI